MADEYILNTTDYEFTLFEHQGLGGTRKYIASPKKKQMPKLLVKHGGEYSPVAAIICTLGLARLLE